MRLFLRCCCWLSLSLPFAAGARAQGQLDTVRVRAPAEVHRLHRSQQETVLGYDFLGDSLLLVTRSVVGQTGRLLLVSPTGATLHAQPLQRPPEGLFSVCTGSLYVLFDTCFCAVLGSQEAGIHLGAPEPRSLLAPLTACEYAVGNRLYLRRSDPLRFQVTYGSQLLDDSVFRPFYATSDGDAELGSWEDIDRALASVKATGNYTLFGIILRNRAMLNNLAFRDLNTRLLLHADSPVVADPTAGLFRFFTPGGAAVRAVPMRFERDALHAFRVLRDEATGQQYLHRFGDPAAQTLQAIDLTAGTPFGPVVDLRRVGAGHVRIHRGRIYYLWQAASGETRGLYVQPGFDAD